MGLGSGFTEFMPLLPSGSHRVNAGVWVSPLTNYPRRMSPPPLLSLLASLDRDKIGTETVFATLLAWAEVAVDVLDQLKMIDRLSNGKRIQAILAPFVRRVEPGQDDSHMEKVRCVWEPDQKALGNLHSPPTGNGRDLTV